MSVGTEFPEEGDRALLIFPSGEERVVTLKRGGAIHTKYGIVKHEDILKKAWGSEVETSTGFRIFVQKPTFTEVVYAIFSRKSQVIYEKEASMMIMESGIGFGSAVGESGVGSGFLTAHILRAIGSEKNYWGYEMREDMAEIAVKNLGLLGFNVRDRIIIKDVKEGIEQKGFHAFFLDLPEPWEAMKAIHSSLAPSARVVAFVPSANQVIKTLSDQEVKRRYHPHKVYELLERDYEREGEALRPKFYQKSFSGYIMVFLKKSEIR